MNDLLERDSFDADKIPGSSNVLLNVACCQTYLKIYDKRKRFKFRIVMHRWLGS
jgi:hypothetical protein